MPVVNRTRVTSRAPLTLLLFMAILVVGLISARAIGLLGAGEPASGTPTLPISSPAGSSSASSGIPTLSAFDLKVLMITSATDVTSGPDLPGFAPKITRTQAVDIASAEIGRPNSPTRLLEGRAPETAEGPDRTV